ncbi:hypothetical protein [Streptomyces sp. NPDC051642]
MPGRPGQPAQTRGTTASVTTTNTTWGSINSNDEMSFNTDPPPPGA